MWTGGRGRDVARSEGTHHPLPRLDRQGRQCACNHIPSERLHLGRGVGVGHLGSGTGFVERPAPRVADLVPCRCQLVRGVSASSPLIWHCHSPCPVGAVRPTRRTACDPRGYGCSSAVRLRPTASPSSGRPGTSHPLLRASAAPLPVVYPRGSSLYGASILGVPFVYHTPRRKRWLLHDSSTRSYISIAAGNPNDPFGPVRYSPSMSAETVAVPGNRPVRTRSEGVAGPQIRLGCSR